MKVIVHQRHHSLDNTNFTCETKKIMKLFCAVIAAISLFAAANAGVADIVLEPEYGLMSDDFLLVVQEKAKQSTWTVSVL